MKLSKSSGSGREILPLAMRLAANTLIDASTAIVTAPMANSVMRVINTLTKMPR